MNFQEIADQLGISTSRVMQIYTEALRKMQFYGGADLKIYLEK